MVLNVQVNQLTLTEHIDLSVKYLSYQTITRIKMIVPKVVIQTIKTVGLHI